jgi:hypothetical protein
MSWNTNSKRTCPAAKMFISSLILAVLPQQTGQTTKMIAA